MIVAITGHRPDKLGGWKTPNPTYTLVKKGLHEAFDFLKPHYVITGMALGVDQWAAEICVSRGIPFIAAIPCDNQDYPWFPKDQVNYKYLISKAFQAHVISPGPYDPSKMHIRNRWMVDSCNVLVAVWNGSMGGTGSCVSYAKSVNKKTHYVSLQSSAASIAELKAPLTEEAIAIIDKLQTSEFIKGVKDKAKAAEKAQLAAAKKAHAAKVAEAKISMTNPPGGLSRTGAP